MSGVGTRANPGRIPAPAGRDPTAPGRRTMDTWDRVYLALRVAALAIGIAYVPLGGLPESQRPVVLTAFGGFAGYTLLLYAGSWTLLQSRFNRRLYLTLAGLDLGFVVLLMHLTGNEASPFYRALYLWVAMLAFYFGKWGGTAASAVAFLVFAWFFGSTHIEVDTWSLLIKAGGLLLHGPVIGLLVSEHRDTVRALERARRELSSRRGDGP